MIERNFPEQHNTYRNFRWNLFTDDLDIWPDTGVYSPEIFLCILCALFWCKLSGLGSRRQCRLRILIPVPDPSHLQLDRYAHRTPIYLCVLFLQIAPRQPSAVAVAIELSRRWDHIAYTMRGTIPPKNPPFETARLFELRPTNYPVSKLAHPQQIELKRRAQQAAHWISIKFNNLLLFSSCVTSPTWVQWNYRSMH